MKIVSILIAIILCCTKVQAAAEVVTPADYLILQSIGDYHSSGKGKCGNGAGLLGAATHFRVDHTDTTCRTGYYFTAQDIAVSVQITQHSDSASAKWLLHELDREFRNYYGIPDPSFIVQVIDGQTLLTFGSAGWDYRWISGNKVIDIEYRDLQMSKPEPLEIIQAYLAKHPSTLPAVTTKVVMSSANKTAWIKDEMDRRLWLCDKWFMQLQLGKAQQSQTLQESVKSMNVFLDYRDKYYGIKAANEKNLLASSLSQNNITTIKAKLAEFKKWWTENKDKGFRLP